MAHTPGPWQTRPIPDAGQIAIAQPNKMFPFASVGPWYDPKEGKPELTDTDYANAALIAAAPDLLEALRWFVNDIDGSHTVMVDFDANVARARAAIAEAEGRS